MPACRRRWADRMSNADKLRDPNPWHPITDAVDLKHLGKLNEEAGELVSATARCIIQGIDECEPVTGKCNREWLEDEIADVEAGIALAKERFHLRVDRIARRRDKKIIHLSRWHRQA